MNTLEFLQRILPTSGFYAFFATGKDRIPHQKLYGSIEELAEACLDYDKRGVNAYYGISSYQTIHNRTQENIHATKVIPVDVDCGPGKPYATQAEAAQALLKFVQVNKLPPPMVVSSGGGLHGYWLLTAEVDQTAWKEVAFALRDAAIQQGFYIDTGKTGDGACVLRPAGCSNYKLDSPRPVRVVSVGAPTPISEIQNRLPAFQRTHVSKHSHTSPLSAALAVKQDYPPADGGAIARKCRQIEAIAKKRGDVEEPLWYGAMGIAGYCKDDEFIAVSWSDGHAGYTENDTIRKMEQWRTTTTGPATCSYFKGQNPSGCKDCKFDGRVSSPIVLGLRYEEVAIDSSAPDREAAMVAVPKPFKRTASGIKVVVDEADLDVCDFDLYPLGQGKDEHLGYEVARFKWKRPLVGWSLLEVPVRDLAEGARDFGKHLGDSGIVPVNKHQATYMSILLRSFMAELNATKAASNLYSSMGWKEDFSEFVLGPTIYRKDKNGSVVREPIGLSKNAPKHILNAYTQKGNAKDWISFSKTLDNPNLAYYRFVLGAAFGSPLWAFGGLGGVVISLFGETGAGKTTIQNWVQSVYGNPAELLIPAVATQNATFSRLGMYNNLPATIDEMSVLPAKDTANFIYWASLGKDKPRLGADSVERDTRKFSTMIIGSTNMSLNAKLLNANTENTALSMRLLELTIPRHPFFAENSDSGRAIYSFLHANYGTVGPLYIEHLLNIGVDRIRDMVNEGLVSFRTKYGVGFSGEERFWEHAIVLSDLGNSIAKDAGLIDYDYEKGTDWVLGQIDPLRKGVIEQKQDCFDLLAAYLSENTGSSLVVTHTGTNAPHYDINRIPRDEILVRYNLFRKIQGDAFSSGVVFLNRTSFYRWLTTNGHDPKSVRQALFDEGVITQPASDRFYMARDTGIKAGQVYVLGVNLSHARLSGVLNDADQTASLGQLKEVKK